MDPETSGKKPRLGGRSARVRQQVLAEAQDLLVTEGLEGFSIAKVAERSGVHETSIYRRWKTKTGLVLEVFLESVARVLKLPETGNLRSDLLVMVERLGQMFRSADGALYRSLLQTSDPELSELRRQFWQTRLVQLSAVVEQAQARGELPPTVEPVPFLEMFIGPLWFRELVSLEPWNEWPVEAMLDRLLAAFTEPGNKRSEVASGRPEPSPEPGNE